MTNSAPHTRVLRAVGGSPLCNPKAACQPCDRSDLQLLLVGPSLVTKEHAAALSQAHLTWSPTFDADFSGIKREATAPVARLLAAGYVYLFYPHRQCWDVWQIMPNHLTRKILHQVEVQQYALRQAAFINAKEAKQCARGAANIPAHLISVLGSQTTDSLWLAYSAHLWSPAVMQRFAENPPVDVIGPDGNPAGKKPLRDVRGKYISPSGILNGQLPAGAMVLNAKHLASHVADYCAADRAGVWPSDQYKHAFSNAIQPLNATRFGQAEEVERNVRAMERTLSPPANRELYLNKTLILMLPDDIGVIETHNHLRLTAKEAREVWVTGGPDFTPPNPNSTNNGSDPLRAWKLRSALHLDMIENWVFAEKLKQQKAMLDAGGYRRTTVISAFEYDMIQKQEAKTGELVNPPGTRYEKLAGKPERYKVTWPEDYVQDGIEGIAHKNSEGRINRYRQKVRMPELKQFREAFTQDMQRWTDHLTALDADYVTWLTHPRLASALAYEFDTHINLLKPDSTHGSPLQQVADVFARIEAVDKAWAGGALTPRSARQLAAAFGKDPQAPATWINSALLEPFGYAKAIAEDKGKKKDAAEKINGLIRELPETIKEALHSHHKLHGEALESLTHVQQQAAHLQTALVLKDNAQAIGVTARSTAEAGQAMRLHIRTASLLSIATNPGAERYVTINVKLPTGTALDETLNVFNRGELGITLEPKSETTRQVRRRSGNELRRMGKRAGTPEYQPVILTQKHLQTLEQQALRQGDELVEVIASDVLGTQLPQNFRLPKQTALNLIGEQASMAKAGTQALLSRQGLVVGVLWGFQVSALLDALNKLDTTDGTAHTDALMSVLTSATGITEGALTLGSGYYSLQTQGSKLVLSSMLTRAAVVRLTASIVGAAGSAFDAVAAYAKYKAAKNRGNIEAAAAYQQSSRLFFASSTNLFLGGGLSFANATVSRFALSRAVVTAAGQIALRTGTAAAAGISAEMAGVGAATLVGSSLTGIGILLGIAGFGYLLYAESMEDDLNEIFLKRSYWGTGDTLQAKFGGSEPAKDRNLTYTLQQQQNWASRGLNEEQRGFNALSVGIKATLEWHDNTLSTDVLQARVESAINPENQRQLALTLTVSNRQGQVLLTERKTGLPLTLDKDSGRYVVDLKWPLTDAQWKTAQVARVEYNLFQQHERVSVARDALEVQKKPT